MKSRRVIYVAAQRLHRFCWSLETLSAGRDLQRQPTTPQPETLACEVAEEGIVEPTSREIQPD